MWYDDYMGTSPSTTKRLERRKWQKKSTYHGFTEARKRANQKYIDKFVEVKVRMTPERRVSIQEHAAAMGESTTAFVNRAIDEAMARDTQK